MRNLENSKYLPVPRGVYDSGSETENICDNGQDSGCVITKEKQFT